MPRAIARDGTTISYGVFGRRGGEPLLMLMGVGLDRMGWVRQAPVLGRHYRCIAVDNRGSGRSDVPEGPYDLLTMAYDAMAVMDAEGLESANVMGASMGGVLSTIIAVTHPERVRTLILACSACQTKDWRRNLFTEWIELAETEGKRAFALENLRWVINRRSLRRMWMATPLVAPLVVRSSVEGVVGQMRAIVDFDDGLREDLSRITAPTFVLVGSQDILTPVADSEELADRIPGATLEVMGGAAHGFMVTKSSAFNRLVGDWLGEQRAIAQPAG